MLLCLLRLETGFVAFAAVPIERYPLARLASERLIKPHPLLVPRRSVSGAPLRVGACHVGRAGC